MDQRDGTEDESLAYITETIFVPYCATAECHSTFKQAGFPGGQPIVLDTIEHAQTTLQQSGGFGPGMLSCSITHADGTVTGPFDPCDTNADPTGNSVDSTELLEILGVEGQSYANLRMPYDQALPNKDIQFIAQWIIDGANGYVPNSSDTDDAAGSN